MYEYPPQIETSIFDVWLVRRTVRTSEPCNRNLWYDDQQYWGQIFRLL